MATVEITRQDLDWDAGLRHGTTGAVGKQLVRVLAEQGVHSPDTVMQIARALANQEPPLHHGSEGLPGSYDYFIMGAQAALAEIVEAATTGVGA